MLSEAFYKRDWADSPVLDQSIEFLVTTFKSNNKADCIPRSERQPDRFTRRAIISVDLWRCE